MLKNSLEKPLTLFERAHFKLLEKSNITAIGASEHLSKIIHVLKCFCLVCYALNVITLPSPLLHLQMPEHVANVTPLLKGYAHSGFFK